MSVSTFSSFCAYFSEAVMSHPPSTVYALKIHQNIRYRSTFR